MADLDSKRLVVVLGAGASFDVCPDKGPIIDSAYRPPTLKTMFQEAVFDRAFAGLQRAHSIMGDVRTAARATRPTAFEEKLAQLAASEDSDIRLAMEQVPLALQCFFTEVSEKYTTQAINYSALLTRLMLRGFRVFFATLNYDTLLEQAAAQYSGHDILAKGSRYYSDNQKWSIAKLHGSVDWGFPWFQQTEFNSVYQASTRLQPPYRSRTEITLRAKFNTVSNGWMHYPAMVLPVAGKYEFVCPPAMETRLADFVKYCQNYLFIGFSAQDRDVLDFLNLNVPRGEPSHIPSIRAGIVSYQDQDDILDRLMSSVTALRDLPEFGLTKTYAQGFTKFVEDDLDDFLDFLDESLDQVIIRGLNEASQRSQIARERERQTRRSGF